MTDERWHASGCAAAVGFVALIILLPFVVIVAVIASTGDDGLPTCDAERVDLPWQDGTDPWRSAPFRLRDDERVLVRVALSPDGGVIQPGQTVHIVPAGTPLPDATTATTTSAPSSGIVVGSGVNAVDEFVRLGAGTWEVVVRGGAGRVTVQHPC